MMRCAITSGVSIFLTPIPSMPSPAFQARLPRLDVSDTEPPARAFSRAARDLTETADGRRTSAVTRPATEEFSNRAPSATAFSTAPAFSSGEAITASDMPGTVTGAAFAAAGTRDLAATGMEALLAAAFKLGAASAPGVKVGTYTEEAP